MPPSFPPPRTGSDGGFDTTHTRRTARRHIGDAIGKTAMARRAVDHGDRDAALTAIHAARAALASAERALGGRDDSGGHQ